MLTVLAILNIIYIVSNANKKISIVNLNVYIVTDVNHRPKHEQYSTILLVNRHWTGLGKKDNIISIQSTLYWISEENVNVSSPCSPLPNCSLGEFIWILVHAAKYLPVCAYGNCRGETVWCLNFNTNAFYCFTRWNPHGNLH